MKKVPEDIGRGFTDEVMARMFMEQNQHLLVKYPDTRRAASNDVVIDPKLLEGLGRRHPTVPPELRPYQSGKTGIVKRANPPKQFHADIPLKVPGS